MTDYKATADQWAHEEHWATESSTASCILELRARVKNLEENLGFTVEAVSSLEDSVLEPKFNSQSSPNSLQIRSSLVEQVRNAIASQYDPKDYCWDEARAAIRAVADWAQSSGLYEAAWLLEQEATQ